jgi:hypothetical protein
MDPEKLKVIKEWRTPESVSDIQQFVGFCGFYRSFIKDFPRYTRHSMNLQSAYLEPENER